MYARRIKWRSEKWDLIFQPSKSLIRPICQDHAPKSLSHASIIESHCSRGYLVRRYLFTLSSSRGVAAGNNYIGLHGRSSTFLRSQLRVFSSKGNGRNASQDKYVPLSDGSKLDEVETSPEKTDENVKRSDADAHARLCEQDQKEWVHNKKLANESKKKESLILTRRQKFKRDYLQRVVPWQKIAPSWETFPYYIKENTKNLLVECAASHLKHQKFASSYGNRLTSSSGRILLQSAPGTELYRERLVKALARDLKVPLLVLDSGVLSPYDFSDECSSDEDNASDVETENDASNEDEWTSSSAATTDCIDAEAEVEVALEKLSFFAYKEAEERVDGSFESLSESEAAEPFDNFKRLLKKGDRVKYTGPSLTVEAENSLNRLIHNGELGEVYKVDGDRVSVILDISENQNSGESDSPAYWIDVNEVEYDPETQIEDCYVAIEALGEVLRSFRPLIVYFPDSSQWLSGAIPKSSREEFVHKFQKMFEQLSGPVVLICGQNKSGTGSKGKERFTAVLPNFGRLAKLPLSLRQLTDGLRPSKRSEDDKIYDLFTNVFCLDSPKEDDQLKIFNDQVEEDRRIMVSRSNLNELHEVLEENGLSCTDLLTVNTDGVILTKQKAEQIVGWAKNNYLSSCLAPHVKGDKLHLPRESLEISILRLKDQDTVSLKPLQNLKNLAKDEYETNFVSAVVPPGEIGVKFDDIGALEDVKKALNELVILPMRRPELFSRGNLLRPCKGILLFGPPGTGKTLLAKALATEAGANFLSITGSNLTSKWFGDAEKLTKSLFSFAAKLAPVIIFVDEVDSLLGARGGAFEHEATRRMRNEFMAAWDGLRSKDSQRILILGATNRPFDLDDAVIRRLPRRIYVDLPDAENRIKILKIFLAEENLQPDFHFHELGNATEGYSGSDLKNLCIAAAYRPVQELLEGEKGSQNGVPVLRPLSLDDFIESKAKVGPSVAFDATSMNELRKWNEQYGEGGSRRKLPFGF